MCVDVFGSKIESGVVYSCLCVYKFLPLELSSLRDASPAAWSSDVLRWFVMRTRTLVVFPRGNFCPEVFMLTVGILEQTVRRMGNQASSW